MKLNNVDQIMMDSKDGFNSVLEGPDPQDLTPVSVPVEKPLTQVQQMRMWLQNEENLRQLAAAEMTWEDFKDLGEMDDADEFYEQFGQPSMTKYEMQAEILRQHSNPNRGLDLQEVNDERAKAAATKLNHGSGDDRGTGSVAVPGSSAGEATGEGTRSTPGENQEE